MLNAEELLVENLHTRVKHLNDVQHAIDLNSETSEYSP